MQGDDPPYLPVGTDVSAKYKGAFCEAKVKKVVRNIKCKVTLKAGGSITVNDDVIKGTLRVGSTVEVKQDSKKEAIEAIISKIQDCSQYTVVFDDGDITTLRRSALCLKSGRHFNESETLDQLPLTHPEHFSTPVIAGRRGRRGRAQSDESEGEVPSQAVKADSAEREPHVGRVVLVEAAGGTERRRPHQPAFPALVVAPTPQIKVKEDYLVRSFKDGRYYTVPKKEAREFRKGGAPLEWAGVDAALQYLNAGVLPPHWDRAALFNEPRNTSDDSSDDEPREEKDHFVAQLYKFMDDRGTPLDRNPTIASRDIDLYRLFRVVQKLGGYNRVTNQNQWKTIADKMGFHPVTTNITNLCKQAYKKFLHSFEDFYRKLGVTLVAHPRGARTPPAGRSLIRDRDKQPPASSSTCSTPTGPPIQRVKDKDSDKSETDKSEKDDKSEKGDKKEKSNISDGEDSADNQPLIAAAAPKVIEKEKEKIAVTPVIEEKPTPNPRSQSKGRAITPPVKMERTPKRKQMSTKSESANTSVSRASRRPHVSTDSDSSGRASRCGLIKKMPSRRSQSANSASSGNTIASNSSKRPRKRKTTEPSTNEPARGVSKVKAEVGDKLKVYYGPTQSESKVTYEAKVIEISPEGMLRVHYTGWNTRYDEWIKPQRIAINVTQHEARNKKGSGLNRRVRAKRTEESSTRSDSDTSDSDDEEVKRPPKKSEEKSDCKTPKSKDAKSSDSSSSSRPRKRPVRTVSTPTNVSPAKKPRPSVSTHQGRDYDLNEIRSELKGFNTVKQEPEEIKLEPAEKEVTTINPQPASSTESPQPEKQPEDVYEFKEPEPFELELHDEKKKRTHRIFDDISPSKYASTLSKSLSEEISEDPLKPRPSSVRSPSMSPFRDFGTTRESERQSPEDDSKDGMFSLDDDSFQGDCSLGPTFEGFTPAKNQETYSKKSKVSKLRQLIDDSPDSPADDEQSSDDEPEDVVMKEVNEDEEERKPSPALQKEEMKSSEEPVKEERIEPEPPLDMDKEEVIPEVITPILSLPEPSKTPPPLITDVIKQSEPIKMELTKVELENKTESVQKIEPPKKVEPFKNVELPQKIELKKVEPVKKAEMSKKTEPPKKIDPTQKTELPKKTDLPQKSETSKKTEPNKKSEPLKKTEFPKKTEPPKKVDAPKKTEPPKKVDPPKKTELPKKTEPHKKIDPPKKVEPLKKTEPFKKIELPKKSETLKKIDPSKKVEPPKRVELVKKPETPKKLEAINKLDQPKKVELPKKAEPPIIIETSTAVATVTSSAAVSTSPARIEVKEELKPDIKEGVVVNVLSIPLPPDEPNKSPPTVTPTIKMETEPMKPIDPPSSPLIDTEEDKSEPDSPARIDVLPEPPPGFLLQSEGPKIAEKLLKAISSAKRLSESPPPIDHRPNTPKTDTLTTIKPEIKLSPISPEPRTSVLKIEPIKPVVKTTEQVKKGDDSIFGEPSNLLELKRDSPETKKKVEESTTPRLQSPLSILERRKSVAELPLSVPGKNNKVLSDTIQKLSSQINQTVSVANIPLPPYPPEDRSESSDSDDSDRRLIIDKISLEEWGSAEASRAGVLGEGVAGRTVGAGLRALHAEKSAGEWSAGESLLMLEDACKNERKHSASVVVAGSGRVASGSVPGVVVGPSGGGEEDSNISLLLCEETIPGSPAPDAEPAPQRARPHMPFASAPPHHHNLPKEERRGSGRGYGAEVAGPPSGAGASGAGAAGAGPRAEPAGWGTRRTLIDNTPPTTPDSSLDLSPHRERRMSERDSPSERKDDDDDNRPNDNMDIEKPSHGGRSRKASESSCAGASRGRRRARRDTDDHHVATLKYNFYVELDPTWDSQTRINVLTTRLSDLRKTYHSVKTELAAIDRRRKKLRRKEREAVKAAKAACL